MELPEDREVIYRINKEAFEQDDEAKLVDALREAADPFLSFVAVKDGRIVGHIVYSPAVIDDKHNGLGLAPMAVLPECQRSGVGTQLVKDSLEELVARDYPWVIVLGHPGYYPRFGFVPSVERGIQDEYGAPPEAFMVLELMPGKLKGVTGTARYHEAFASV